MGASVSAPPTGEAKDKLLERVNEICAEAGVFIASADVFLLCTGAGFSADSGLAVYADVAQVPAYASRGLSYHDICQPRWLHKDADLFWGFWGQCYNDYRSTAPHKGYEIIESWARRQFRSSGVAKAVKTELSRSDRWMKDSENSAYRVNEFPGAFFAFTSNVDAHHFDWYRACEIHECHGNTEIFQCTDRNCKRIWRAPTDYKFVVEKDTMLAHNCQLSEAATDEGANINHWAAEKPCIGHVRGGGRPHMLRHMPAAAAPTSAGFETNHPQCPTCKKDARPAILMFGDQGWRADAAQEARFQAWLEAVKSVARSSDTPLKVAVLEVGAGDNVPTVRRTSEMAALEFKEEGMDVRLIRVNPLQPLGDDEDLEEGAKHGDMVLPILARGLASIEKIDAAMVRRIRSAAI